MLILTQKNDQVILDFSQATDAELLSLRHRPIVQRTLSGHHVRNGYDAPKFVKVHRAEVVASIRAHGPRR